jgi:hypothetical protein
MQNLERLSDRHRAYLLYCWADSASDLPHSRTWRFAVTRVPCRNRPQGLACISDLIVFLQHELDNLEDITDGLAFEGDNASRHDQVPPTEPTTLGIDN